MRRALASAVVAATVLIALAVPAVAAARPEPWRIAFITYRAVDAVCNGHRVQTRLSDTEFAEARAIQSDVVDLVNTLHPQIRLTPTFVTRGVLTSLSPLGSGCWPGPHDVPSAGAFDSQYVMFDPRDPSTGGWYFPWGGMSYTSGTFPYGGGYSTSVAIGYSIDWRRSVVLNEWLHPTAGWYRERGAYVADSEWDAQYGYTDHDAFKRAIVAGTLPDRNGDGHPDGITRWHLRKAGTPQ